MLGKVKSKKNRYVKKKPAKNRAESLRRGFYILLKSTFLAVAMVGMSLVFIFVHDVLTQCDYFNAHHIDVTGARRLSADQILKAGGLETGDNLVALNLRTIRKKLRAHPWIADADVSRTFPDRIDIQIREQLPLAVIDFGKPFLINHSGRVFKEAAASETSGLPWITGISYGDWKASEPAQNLHPEADSPGFTAVMEFLKMKPSARSLPVEMIKTIAVDREMGLMVETPAAIQRIRLGYGDYAKKCRRLEMIYAWLAENDMEIDTIAKIDLRNPDHIVATPGKETLSENNEKEV